MITPTQVQGPGCGEKPSGTAFGCPRDFLGNRFVYATLSPRARGLSLGVNLNPDKRCNFDCVYCEVNRAEARVESRLDIPVMMDELERSLVMVLSGRIHEQPCYRSAPPELLELRHVTLSGDGEPTLCEDFFEAVESVVHLRSGGRFPFFKLVLITNCSGLDHPDVAEGISLLSPRDEIWLKLDAGTQDHMDRVNRPDCSLDKILSNILRVGRVRPVVIQSLFVSIQGVMPSAPEIEAYLQRLRELKEGGAQVSLVQVYSATRPTAHSECGHLSLRMLSGIAQRVRDATGWKAEMF